MLKDETTKMTGSLRSLRVGDNAWPVGGDGRPENSQVRLWRVEPDLTSFVKAGDLLTMKDACVYPGRRALAISRNQRLIGYIPDIYVVALIRARRAYHVAVTASTKFNSRGWCWVNVRFYPR